MWWIFLIAAAGVVLLFAFMIAPGRPGKKKDPFYGRNIAHRGLFEKDQSVPENSLAAFARAFDEGYGTELDVQLSRDGRVVVFHDDTLNRMCGVDARVDSKTYEELSALRLLGSDEKIPLFSEVLELAGGRGPFIVELKTTKKRKELFEKTVALLRDYPGEVCVESFDPFLVARFRFHAPRYFRGFLAQPPKCYDGKLTGFLLGNVLLNFICRPHFIAYKIGKKPFPTRAAISLGAVPVAWTSHDADAEKSNDIVIFEHYRPEVHFK